MSLLLYNSLCFLPFLELAALVLVLTRQMLKVPRFVPIIYTLVIFFGLCFLQIPLLPVVSYHVGFFMPVVLAIFFFCYKRSVELDWIRAAVVFLWGCVVTSFASGFIQVYIVRRMMIGEDVNTDLFTQILRVILAFIIFVIFYFMTKGWQPGFLMSDAVPGLLWAVWIPILILFLSLNIGLISYAHQIFMTHAAFMLFLLILFGMFFLVIFLTEIFYTMADTYISTAKLKDQQRFLDLQKVEYKKLQAQMDDTSRMRHDFRHSINMLQDLVEQEDIHGLREFFSQYENGRLERTVMNYCVNPAINGVLNHYAFAAREADIDFTLQVDLPEELIVSDAEFCSLIGNLMENAIEACKNLEPSKRKFSFSIVAKNDVNLYIVSTNSFDGHIEKEKDQFRSTKHEGMGIGTRSITETVHKYNGSVRFHYSEEEFYVDIMMLLSP